MKQLTLKLLRTVDETVIQAKLLKYILEEKLDMLVFSSDHLCCDKCEEPYFEFDYNSYDYVLCKDCFITEATYLAEINYVF